MASFDSKTISHIHHELHSHLPSEPALRTKALESLLVEKGLIDPAAVDAWVEMYRDEIGPKRGAAVVARAWRDPAFKARLLADGTTAIAEFGFAGRATGHLQRSRTRRTCITSSPASFQLRCPHLPYSFRRRASLPSYSGIPGWAMEGKSERDGDGGELGPIGGAGFSLQVARMEAHGRLADPHCLGDAGSRLPGDEVRQALALAVSEFRRRKGHELGWLPRSVSARSKTTPASARRAKRSSGLLRIARADERHRAERTVSGALRHDVTAAHSETPAMFKDRVGGMVARQERAQFGCPDGRP